METAIKTIDYTRSEVRMPCQDFEMMNFSLMNGSQNENVAMIVFDKSNSGLGCSCHFHPSLEIGGQLNLFNLIIYEVRWIQQMTDHVINVGLKLIKEL